MRILAALQENNARRESARGETKQEREVLAELSNGVVAPAVIEQPPRWPAVIDTRSDQLIAREPLLPRPAGWVQQMIKSPSTTDF